MLLYYSPSIYPNHHFLELNWVKYVVHFYSVLKNAHLVLNSFYSFSIVLTSYTCVMLISLNMPRELSLTMTIGKLNRKIRLTGKLGMIVCVFFILSILDLLISQSLILRYLGIHPYWGVFATLSVILLLLGANYMFFSQKKRLMAQEGKAEILKMNKTGDTWEIAFGLGQTHGLQKEDIILIQDLDDNVHGIGEVAEVFPSYANAIVSDLEVIHPSFLVRRRDKIAKASLDGHLRR